MDPDLSQLRDIHLPEPVSWWPPAPGWWLFAAVLLLAVGALAAYRYRRGKRWRRAALGELERLRTASELRHRDAADILRDVSVLLRRVAVSRFPREEVAALHGEQWLAFLDRTLDEGTAFRHEIGQQLIVAPYRPAADVDHDQLRPMFALCERWLRKLPGKARNVPV